MAQGQKDGDDSKEITKDKFSIAHAVIESRLGVIWNAVDSIDTKTNIILGFASVILVVLAGLLSSQAITLSPIQMIFPLVALLLYIALVILSILSYRIRGWSYNPDPKTLIGHCKDATRSLDDIQEWILSECQSACDGNLELLKKKSDYTNWVMYLFAAETVVLSAGLICQILKL